MKSFFFIEKLCAEHLPFRKYLWNQFVAGLRYQVNCARSDIQPGKNRFDGFPPLGGPAARHPRHGRLPSASRLPRC